MNAQGRLLVHGHALDDEAASEWWADQAKTRRAGLETARRRARCSVTIYQPW